MNGFLTFEQLVALLAALAHPAVRTATFVAALPLGWTGRWALPARVPVERLPELWLSDLGRVLAGLFLTFLSVLCALAFLTGTIAAAIRDFDTWPAGWTVTQIAIALAILTGCLYLAGLAVSWIGAACMLLGACGSVWTWARYLTGNVSTGSSGSVFDHWNE